MDHAMSPEQIEKIKFITAWLAAAGLAVSEDEVSKVLRHFEKNKAVDAHLLNLLLSFNGALAAFKTSKQWADNYPLYKDSVVEHWLAMCVRAARPPPFKNGDHDHHDDGHGGHDDHDGHSGHDDHGHPPAKPSDPPEAKTPDRIVVWTKRMFIIFLVLIAFVLGYALSPTIQNRDVNSLRDELKNAKAALVAEQAKPKGCTKEELTAEAEASYKSCSDAWKLKLTGSVKAPVSAPAVTPPSP